MVLFLTAFNTLFRALLVPRWSEVERDRLGLRKKRRYTYTQYTISIQENQHRPQYATVWAWLVSVGVAR